MYSNRKPYYQLKKSMREFFSGYSRFIKQSAMKESVAEKPYIDSEYPQMHLSLPQWHLNSINLPVFGFEHTRPVFKPPKISAFPEPTMRYRTLTVRYVKPTCALDTWNTAEIVEPGDIIRFEGDADISGPRSRGSMCTWILSASSEFVRIRVLDDDAWNDGENPEFEAEILEGAPGVVLICAKMSFGGAVSSWTWATIGGMPVTMQYKHGIFPHMLVSAGEQPVQLAQKQYFPSTYYCGCFEVFVDAEFKWDTENSVEMLTSSSSGILYVLGGCGPYDWTLTYDYGQGFTLDMIETPLGDRDNIIETDATVYGRVTITVVDDNGEEVSGKVYSYWREDWEAVPLSSVHNWEYIEYYSYSFGYSEASIVSFETEKVLKMEIEIDTNDYWIQHYPEIDLTVSPEISLNLGLYTGFDCTAYLASLVPATFTEAECNSDCTGVNDFRWGFGAEFSLGFQWRAIGGNFNYSWYGVETLTQCVYTSDPDSPTCEYTTVGGEPFATFINRLGSWSSLQTLILGDPVPWGNSSYEITNVYPYLYLDMLWSAVTFHGTTNIQVYFSDIILTPV